MCLALSPGHRPPGPGCALSPRRTVERGLPSAASRHGLPRCRAAAQLVEKRRKVTAKTRAAELHEKRCSERKARLAADREEALRRRAMTVDLGSLESERQQM